MHTFLNRTLPMVAAVLLGFGSLPAQAHPAVEEMSQAANAFLSTLSPEQKGKAQIAFSDEERKNWHFVPKERKGLTFKEMQPYQRPLAMALLSSGLSQRGFAKATTIMSLEEVLREMESKAPRMVRDPEMYYVSIFGKPGTKETWGWRLEGHHVSVNFTVVDGNYVAATPSFLGTNPAEIKAGARQGLRVLGLEEDLGRQLVQSLSQEQKKIAIFSAEAPKEIITVAERSIKPLDKTGIAQAQLTPAQAELLQKLIREYVERTRPELAQADLAKIQEAGLDKIHFAWAGSLEKGEGHYYRVQGPTFLLEYDNTQNNNNHVHAVWRDFAHDFGVDLLKEHYGNTPHPAVK